MPFSTKQSDVYYNDETKELFVCTVSSVSASRCDGTDDAVFGALPIIYKTDKESNYKKRVYPKNLETLTSDPNSDLYAVTPNCSEGTNFDSITKPLINYNKTTARYSVTFLGRYTDDGDGLSLNNYIFEDINSDFYLLDSKTYIPKGKFTNNLFTFENGYINSDLYIAGNTIRNGKPSWFNPDSGVEIERSPDYQVAPMYVQSTSSLGFNLILDNKDVTIDSLSGDTAFPMLYSGGFITYNPKYVAYDPEYTIRVDFRARSFTVPSPTAYGGTQSVGNSATRWIQQWTPAGAGEGFCLSFFKNPDRGTYVVPNGIGSTLGYAVANFSSNEVAGTAHSTVGLFERRNWNPHNGGADAGNVGGNVGNIGSINAGEYNTIIEGTPAESFLGVGFDIGGNFASTSEEKNGWVNGTSYTATPCSVGLRGSSHYSTQVLTSVAMSAVGNTVPMHTSAVSAEFVDYRVDLSNRGTKVTVYNKLTSATDYNTILEFRLNVGVGTAYNAWSGLQTAEEIENNILPPLNVGLSFTTSDKTANFELHKFEVTGVKISNPWQQKKEEVIAGVDSRINYLQESSKNLRENLVNIASEDEVDVEMVIPAKSTIAKAVVNELDNPRISLCDGTDEEPVQEDVDVKITKIRPEQVDKTIEIARSGTIPKIPGSATTIKRPEQQIDTKTIITAKPEEQFSEPKDTVEVDDPPKCMITSFTAICKTQKSGDDRKKIANTSGLAGGMFTTQPEGYPRYSMYQSNEVIITGFPGSAKEIGGFYLFVNGIEALGDPGGMHAASGGSSIMGDSRSGFFAKPDGTVVRTTVQTILQNCKVIQDRWIKELIKKGKNAPKFWELILNRVQDPSTKSLEELYPLNFIELGNWDVVPIDTDPGDNLETKADDYWFREGVCQVFSENDGDDGKLAEDPITPNTNTDDVENFNCEIITIQDLYVKYTKDIQGVTLALDVAIPTGQVTQGGLAANDIVLKIVENRASATNCYFVSVNANTTKPDESLHNRTNNVKSLLKTKLGSIITNL